MDDLKCWALVQSAHEQSRGDMDKKSEVIKVALANLPKEDAKAFSRFFNSRMDQGFSWPLWGAAYIIHGGCGDDSFSDFRASLISRGRAAYEGAVSNPESLASEEFDEKSWFYEGYQYAVRDGIRAAVGSIVSREQPHPKEPSGAEWVEEDVYELFPKLSEKFP